MIKLHKMTGGLAEFAPWCRSVQLWWATNHQAGPSKNRLCQRERKNIFWAVNIELAYTANICGALF